MKRVVVHHFGGPEVVRVVEDVRSPTGSWRSPHQGPGLRCVTERRADARRHLPRRAEAAVHARL